MTTVLPGTIGLTQISGDVGRLIRVGQWMCGDGFTDYQHAFITTDDVGPHGLPMIVTDSPSSTRTIDAHSVRLSPGRSR